MQATARQVIDLLLDVRADLVKVPGTEPRVDTLDRVLAKLSTAGAPSQALQRARRRRIAIALLDLRAGLLAQTRTHDAEAVLRTAQLLVDERRRIKAAP